jgi:hypothetical protein
MPLPRPVSPRAAWRDLLTFLGQRTRYQWIAFALALLIPTATLYIFILDSRTGLDPEPRAVYVQSWPSNRSDEEIKARQKENQARREQSQAERRRQWKALGDRLGM